MLLAACAAGCAASGALIPTVISRLPEPPPPKQSDDPEVVPEDAASATQVPTAPAKVSRSSLRPVPEFTLWGMSAVEGDKESYRSMARLPGLLWGSVLACAILGAIVAWRIGPEPALAVLLPVVPVGVAIAVIDWRTRLIPSRLVLPATGVVIFAAAVITVVTDDPAALTRGLVAMVLVRSFFWVLWFIRSAGMGFGDVRLSAVLGFALGFLGTGEAIVGTYAGFIVFALPGVLLTLIKRDARLLRVPFPFGPFMLIGALLGLVFGQDVWSALTG
ncbi:A24 family peptidase [Nocardioides sp.]|uniref:prepilin peptidase n=1 Tax=Nocardioides sp. TaxID=35761 RepID=UPI003563CB60